MASAVNGRACWAGLASGSSNKAQAEARRHRLMWGGTPKPGMRRKRPSIGKASSTGQGRPAQPWLVPFPEHGKGTGIAVQPGGVLHRTDLAIAEHPADGHVGHQPAKGIAVVV